MRGSNNRLVTLDAMRGIAALLVVIHHQHAFPTPGGYLAVDFFFALSGVVIARAYDEKLRDGLSVGAFMSQRLLRLYPLLAIGMAIGALRAVMLVAMAAKDAPGLWALAVDLVTGALALPSPTSALSLFPLNLPAWSLFFELLINLAYAVALVRMRTSWLIGVLAVAVAALVASTLHYGSFDGGFEWRSIGQGFARVSFAFTAGVLLQRLGWVRPKTGTALAIVPMAVLVAFLTAPVAAVMRETFDLGFAVIAAPALIVLAAAWQPPEGWARRTSTALGDLSYPVYAIHYPVLMFWGYFALKLGVSPMISLVVFLPLICALALILGLKVDPKIRAAASRMAAPRLRPQAA